MAKKHNITDATLSGIVAYLNANGKQKTLETFNLIEETFNRYMREAKRRQIKVDHTASILKRIESIYTKKELEAISKGGRILPGIEKVPIVDFSGKHIRVGAITDTHIVLIQTRNLPVKSKYGAMKGKMVEIDAKRCRNLGIKPGNNDPENLQKLLDCISGGGFVFFNEKPFVRIYKNRYEVQYFHLR